MPAASSCASGRQSPPASSASCAYTTLPPYTGFVVSLEELDPDAPLPVDLLLLHAVSSNTPTSSTKTSRRVTGCDEVASCTVPPKGCVMVCAVGPPPHGTASSRIVSRRHDRGERPAA